ncbi:hypothetical protein D3C73_1098200 [compost metagenome]
MGNAYHHLPCANYLPRLRQGIHYHPVSIRQQRRITGRVFRHISLGLGSVELGFRRVGSCFEPCVS